MFADFGEHIFEVSVFPTFKERCSN